MQKDTLTHVNRLPILTNLVYGCVCKNNYNAVLSLNLQQWPDSAVPNFRNTIEGLFNNCTELAHRVLDAISVGLDLKVPFFFRPRLMYYDDISHKPTLVYKSFKGQYYSGAFY